MHVLKGKCSAFGCRGEVEEISTDERASMRQRNHYLASYEEAGHVTVRAREHTGHSTQRCAIFLSFSVADVVVMLSLLN